MVLTRAPGQIDLLSLAKYCNSSSFQETLEHIMYDCNTWAVGKVLGMQPWSHAAASVLLDLMGF